MSDPLMERIKEAISNVSEKIQGYTQAADGFVKGVTGETVRLDLLTKKLRACLEKLQKLKDDYNMLIQKITALEVQITSLKDITSEAATSAGTEACNEKLNEILGLINVFGESVGDFNGDVEGLKGQVTSLEKVIGGICDEADQLVQQQQDAEGARKKLAEKLGGEGQVDEPVQQPVQEQVEEGLPEGWKKFIDNATGNPYYQGPDGEVTWEKPTSLSLGAAARVTAAGERLKDRADVELAQFAYKNPNDPARQQMLTDMRNAESPFDVKVDDPKYVAKNGRNKKWNVSWMNGPDAPLYSLAEGGTFNDGDGAKEETDKHPSEFSNSMQGGKRKRKTRKKRGGWQTPEKLSSLSKTKPIRTLGYLKKKTKKKKKKKKTRGKKKRKRKRKRTRKR